MRSRYTAYTKSNIEYIIATMLAPANNNFDADAAKQWASNNKWLSLKIISTSGGGANDNVGEVEFIATYKQQDKIYTLHECSKFKRQNSRWFYYDSTPNSTPVTK